MRPEWSRQIETVYHEPCESHVWMQHACTDCIAIDLTGSQIKKLRAIESFLQAVPSSCQISLILVNLRSPEWCPHHIALMAENSCYYRYRHYTLGRKKELPNANGTQPAIKRRFMELALL